MTVATRSYTYSQVTQANQQSELSFLSTLGKQHQDCHSCHTLSGQLADRLCCSHATRGSTLCDMHAIGTSAQPIACRLKTRAHAQQCAFVLLLRASHIRGTGSCIMAQPRVQQELPHGPQAARPSWQPAARCSLKNKPAGATCACAARPRRAAREAASLHCGRGPQLLLDRRQAAQAAGLLLDHAQGRCTRAHTRTLNAMNKAERAGWGAARRNRAGGGVGACMSSSVGNVSKPGAHTNEPTAGMPSGRQPLSRSQALCRAAPAPAPARTRDHSVAAAALYGEQAGEDDAQGEHAGDRSAHVTAGPARPIPALDVLLRLSRASEDRVSPSAGLPRTDMPRSSVQKDAWLPPSTCSRPRRQNAPSCQRRFLPPLPPLSASAGSAPSKQEHHLTPLHCCTASQQAKEQHTMSAVCRCRAA